MICGTTHCHYNQPQKSIDDKDEDTSGNQILMGMRSTIVDEVDGVAEKITPVYLVQ